MPLNLELESFISNSFSESGVILDVRTPAEFTQGRIPHAVNLPLFSNEERAAIGTVYKQVGEEQAIALGYSLVTPRIEKLLESTKKQLKLKNCGLAKVHCWRGGMRSQSVVELFESNSISAVSLKGGYKTFRRWVLHFLEQIPLTSYKIYLLAGMTGSGKTSILQHLKNKGEQVLDLEELACHRGSSFGMLGMPIAPSNEQFENEIAFQWKHFSIDRPIWIEDESRQIGHCKIPNPLFEAMKSAHRFIIERPLKERLSRLCMDYARFNRDELILATERIRKKLGGARVNEICLLITEGEMEGAAKKILEYYDSSYTHSLIKRKQQSSFLSHNNLSDEEWADLIIKQK